MCLCPWQNPRTCPVPGAMLDRRLCGPCTRQPQTKTRGWSSSSVPTRSRVPVTATPQTRTSSFTPSASHMLAVRRHRHPPGHAPRIFSQASVVHFRSWLDASRSSVAATCPRPSPAIRVSPSTAVVLSVN